MAEARYPIIFVPPSMCVSLHKNGEMIWPSQGLSGLARLKRLGDAAPLDPGRVLRVADLPGVGRVDLCGSLLASLEGLGYQEGEDLFLFPYDWHSDIRGAARALAATVPGYAARVRAARGQAGDAAVKFLLVGFSLGVLVCRWYVDKEGGSRHIARMLLAGAYDRGLPSSFAVLRQGLHSAQELPYAYARAQDRALLARLLFLRHDAVVREGIAYYQSLPTTAFVSCNRGRIDIFAREDWLRARDRQRAQSNLRAAYQIQTGLAAPPSVPTTYVYGVGTDTPAGFYFADGGRNLACSPMTVHMGNGDGLVLAQKARSADLQAGVRVAWVESQHAYLLDTPAALALLQELSQVPASLPAVAAREGDDPVEQLVRDYLSAIRGGGLNGDTLEDRKVLALRLPGLSAVGEGLHARLPELDFLGVIAGATPQAPVVIMGEDASTLSAARTAWYLSRNWDDGVGGPLPLQCDLAALQEQPPSTDALLTLVAQSLLRQIGQPQRLVDEECLASLRRLLLRVPTILLCERFEVPLRLGGLGKAGTAIADALRGFSLCRLVLFDASRRFQPDHDLPEAQVYTLREDRRRVRLYAAREPGRAQIHVGLDLDDRVPFERLGGADVRSFSVPLRWPADPGTGAAALLCLKILLRDGASGEDEVAVEHTISPRESFQCSLLPRGAGPRSAGLEVHFTLGDDRLGSTRLDYRAMSDDLLKEATLRRLWSATRDAGLATHEGLDELAQALAPADRALLPWDRDPQVRARQVLQHLNTLRSVAGALPLDLWLGRAEARARLRRLEVPFAEARDELHVYQQQAPQPSAAEARPEALIGANDLVPFAFIPSAMKVGQAVALIEVPRFLRGKREWLAQPCCGTAWLIGPGLIMTNHHVVAARTEMDLPVEDGDLLAQARAATVRFDFDGAGAPGIPYEVDGLLASDRRLDFAVLRLQRPPAIAPLRLAPARLSERQVINIIQHPHGGPKQVAFRNNPVTSLTEDEVRYFTDTDFGSSGSPLCDDLWQVVGLHRASRTLPVMGLEQKSQRYNVGTTIAAIREHLEARHPDLWAEIAAAQPTLTAAVADGSLSAAPWFDKAALDRYRALEVQHQRARAQRTAAAMALRGGEPLLIATARELGLLPEHEGVAVGAAAVLRERLEGIIGTDDLMPVAFLQRGLEAARAVGCIFVEDTTNQEKATGFLIAPRLLLTNHHVLPSAERAAQADVRFFFDRDVDEPPSVQRFRLQPELFFVSDPWLDYTLVAVAERAEGTQAPLADISPLPISLEEVQTNQSLNILQHPGGKAKHVSLRDNRLAAADERKEFYQYHTDTRRGSSGSPVCNDRWQAVALHRAGVPRTNEKQQVLLRDSTLATATSPEDLIDWQANEGVRLGAILAHLRTYAGLSATAAALRDELLALVPEVTP